MCFSYRYFEGGLFHITHSEDLRREPVQRFDWLRNAGFRSRFTPNQNLRRAARIYTTASTLTWTLTEIDRQTDRCTNTDGPSLILYTDRATDRQTDNPYCLVIRKD